MTSLETKDVDRWIGVPLGGGEPRDAVHVNDIRRWVQGMQYPNPLHFDADFAAASRFGGIVAPHSFAVCTDDSHGAAPAIQGEIPGTHMLFGGDEWWFFGPRIQPGDVLRHDRMLFDYKVTETKFAGPTMFSRGDTLYVNQRGEPVAKQRSTSIRYRPDEARRRGEFLGQREGEWSDAELGKVEEAKRVWLRSLLDLGHGRRAVPKRGEKLPPRPIGPHSIASFTTEWRAFLMSVWGAFRPKDGPTSLWSAGWLPEMNRDHEGAKLDPALADGLYRGPSRGHVQDEYAQLIGMPRGYGYGASMGAWILDYLSAWTGEEGEVVHSAMQYRSPALTGDVTWLNGQVEAVDAETKGSGTPVSRTGGPLLARVRVEMTNQRGEAMAGGTAEVRLPGQ